MAHKPSKRKSAGAKARPGFPVSAPNLPRSLSKVNLNAAGIDIGATAHYVAVPEGRDENNVRCFQTFTADLQALADWLKQCGVKTVAMESTGVYWIPVFEVLESRGFEVKLVEPGKLKSVPGRKTDVLDCQWIQQLHNYGLLQGSFVPPEKICILRSYMRQRGMLVEYAGRHVLHMQKALMQMNIQLHHVLNGAFYRRMRTRLGAPKAITATAHKLAKIVYNMLRYGKKYVDVGIEYYEKQYRQRVVKNLERRAAQLQLCLIPIAKLRTELAG